MNIVAHFPLFHTLFKNGKVIIVNPIQSLFHLTANSSAQNLSLPFFRKGQLFHGKVIKLLPNDFALLEIGGTRLNAKLEVGLSAGRRYWFQVEQNEPFPRLKMIPVEGAEKTPANRSTEVLLKQIGLPPTASNKALVSFFAKEGLPFSKAFLQKASPWLANRDVAESLLVIKTIITRQFPIQTDVFQALSSLIKPKPLAVQLQQLSNVLTTISKQTQPVQQLKASLATVLQTITIPIDENGSAIPFPLRQMIHQLGFSYENALFRALKGNALAKDVDALVKTLKPSLLAVLGEDIPVHVKEMVQETIHRLTGQQLLFAGEDPLQQLFFQLPFSIGGRPSDVFIQYQGKKKNGTVDADYCRVLFYLELESLKETVIDVHIQNRMMTIRIYNENKQLEQIAKPLQSVLKERLNDLDYHLASIQWVDLDAKQGRPSPIQSIDGMVSYQGVDMKI